MAFVGERRIALKKRADSERNEIGLPLLEEEDYQQAFAVERLQEPVSYALQFTRAIRKSASSMLTAALQVCYHAITSASRGSHCGGLESCRLRDPPQAENPALQDSFCS